MRKAPRLHGKLELSGLCGGFLGSGEELYSALKPQFHDLSMKYHIKEERYEDEHLRAFMAKQLRSPWLQKLSLCVNAELGLNSELFQFCLSDRFEYLNWDSPMPLDFFLRIYEAFKAYKSVPVCKTRQVKGFFDRSALKELVESLQLECSPIYHKYEWTNEYRREDSCAGSEDCIVSISAVPEIDNELTARVDVTIELKCAGCTFQSCSNVDARNREPRRRLNEDGTEQNDFQDDFHSDHYYYCKYVCR